MTVDVITCYSKQYFSEAKTLCCGTKHTQLKIAALQHKSLSSQVTRLINVGQGRNKHFVIYCAVFNFYMHCGFCSTGNTRDEIGFMGWTCFYFDHCCTIQLTILHSQPVVPHKSFDILFRVGVSSNNHCRRLVPLPGQLLRAG